MAIGLETAGFRFTHVFEIDPYMSARERDKLMARFKAGDLDLLTSVDLFNEGVDVPDVDLIVFMQHHSQSASVCSTVRTRASRQSKEGEPPA